MIGEAFLTGLVTFFVAGGIGIFILIAVCYVFRGIGLYRIMKNRGFKHPWFAWVPVMCDYSMGLIYDDIRKKSGTAEKSGMRIAMIIISAAIYALVIAATISMIVSCGAIPNMNAWGVVFTILFDIIWVAISLAIFFIMQVGLLVLQFITLFVIYKEYSKNYIALFIFTLVVYMAHPFVLFALRKADGQSKFEI